MRLCIFTLSGDNLPRLTDGEVVDLPDPPPNALIAIFNTPSGWRYAINLEPTTLSRLWQASEPVGEPSDCVVCNLDGG